MGENESRGSNSRTIINMNRPGRSIPGKKNAKDAGFNAASYVRPGLTVDEIEEIKEAFDIFDTDNSGSISVKELLNAMKSLGFETKNPAVYKMIADFDTNENGVIEFEEFLDMMTARISDKNTKADLERVALRVVSARARQRDAPIRPGQRCGDGPHLRCERRTLAGNSAMAIIQRHSTRAAGSRGVFEGDTTRDRLREVQKPRSGTP